MKNSARICRLAIASAGIGLLYLTACNKSDNPADTTPAITSFTPAEAAEGATVVITGKNFSPDKLSNTVSFNGKPATVTEARPNELSVTVPEEATNGKITVKVSDQTATSANDFKVNPSAPTITGFTPDSGDPGQEVTITGTRFQNTSKVYFNGTEATNVSFASNTTLRAKVPTGATTGKIKVINGTLEAISAANYYLRPGITGHSPAKQEEAKEIIIEGSNFSTEPGVTKVWFGSREATVTPVSETQVKVKVPTNLPLTPVPIKVIVKALDVISTNNFILLPTITSCTPDHGERGSEVTITGKNFDNTSLIYVDDKAVNMYAASFSADKVIFPVPQDAVGGDIVIKQQHYIVKAGIFNTTDIFVERTPSPYSNNQFRNGAVAFVLNNKIHIGWGLNAMDNTMITDDFVAYDPTTDSWQKSIKAPQSIPGRTAASAIAFGGNIYLGLGITNTNNQTHNGWYRVDSSNNSWTEMTPFPARTFGTACGVVNSNIVVGPGTATTKMYEFNESGTGSWTVKADFGMNLYHSSTFTLNDKFYVGFALHNGGYFKSYKGIDGNGNISTTTEFGGGNALGAPTFVYKDKAYIIDFMTRGVYQYTPDAVGGSWKQVGKNIPNDFRFAKVVNNRVFFIDAFEKVYEYFPNY